MTTRAALPPDPLLCLTWNLHRGRGADGRFDPERTTHVLAHLLCQPRPDVLALQEADAEHPPQTGVVNLTALAAATGLRHAQRDPSLRSTPQSHGFHGNVLLLAPQIAVTHAQALLLPGAYPRGAMVVEARRAGAAFRVIALHLSLSQVRRMRQMQALGRYLDSRPPMRTVLLGDLNEWRPWGGLALSRAVVGRRLTGAVPATFPAAFPLLPLDRILSDGPVRDAEAIGGPRVRAASDHAALRATVLLAPASP